jgi:hypothetical protein
MRFLALLLGALIGCDTVFGLDQPLPHCSQASFAQATPVELGSGEAFSVSWETQRAVIVIAGSAAEMSLADGSLTPIDLGVPYSPLALGLSPEGDSLLFSSAIEPPQLFASVRGGSSWRHDGNVPVGTYAGTPSEDSLGPRRVIVRMRPTGPVQEYEDQGGLWKAVGGLHDFDGVFAANLTPNGLTMVYESSTGDGTSTIFEATRRSISDWFGAPVPILTGDVHAPQLVDDCHRLFVVGGPAAGEQEPSFQHYDL